ncbi:hypothetical protein SAMN05428989_1586 [Pseudoxanthomonas sp. GM95]|uniref:hypothetical protein n=1 Tax=Pseudoxanthomonas sp. GM95 TaxID=1881043 RepID=UPI0008C19D0A|nr:hypothetical protein [Pseudoxanthomonas sp. GM95]SEL16357.1 hypothetical protein SAMN05428989_1586 [Pseudoxanthomonas sp. GM95]
MEIANELLMATLVGIKNGIVRPDLTQWALLESSGLARQGVLTTAGWRLIDPRAHLQIADRPIPS